MKLVRTRHRRLLSTYGWNERTNPIPTNADWLNQTSITFSSYLGDMREWLDSTNQCFESIKRDFEQNGFAVLRQIVDRENLEIYKNMHDVIQNDLITPGRHDLGSHKEKVSTNDSENIGQIMWPSDLIQNSREGPIHRRAYEISKSLMTPSSHNDEISFDFDMLIYKPAHSMTETPWHQDEAYWPSEIPDKQAITVWTALDPATKANGAMWFVPFSHLGELHEHESAGPESHVLKTKNEIKEDMGICVELEAGDAVFWHGRTLHYSRGNATSQKRRTYIVNFRPESCVAFERENGFDHLRKGFADYETQMQVAGDAMRRK